MAKKSAKSSPRDNGMQAFCLHSNEASSKKTLAALSKERTSTARLGMAPSVSPKSLDPETVAQAYLRQTLASESTPDFTSPVVDKVESEFKSIGSEAIPLTGTTTVKFRQMLNKIPVYGSLVTVELDEKNELLGINSSIGTPKGIKPIAKISADEAVKSASAYNADLKLDLTNIVPHLYYFYDVAKSKWHLAFILEDVPVRHSKAKGPVAVRMDFVVDAHSGKVVTTLDRTPTLAASGIDCLGVNRTFQVEKNGTTSLLKDSALNVQTFDFNGKDPDVKASQLPGAPINNPPAFSPSAVSAHANASEVARFLRTTLMRNNIDAAGGLMVSTINCIVVRESEGGLGKEWINAYWDGKQMVYGLRLENDKVISMSAALDVVAHEMMHGVTQKTARLEYRFQSGALNESYSDIFGVIVHNFAKADLSQWDFAIGSGLQPDGTPFRNFADPTKEGQPDKMENYVNTTRDNGGVHANSGIHNKAAHNVLTATRAGTFLFTAKEVAILFYLALTQHLSRTSQFTDSRRAVLQSARTFFRNLPPAQLNIRIAAIEKAFSDVGIA